MCINNNSNLNSYNSDILNRYEDARMWAGISEGEKPLLGVKHGWDGKERSFVLWTDEDSGCISLSQIIFVIREFLGEFEFFRKIGLGISTDDEAIKSAKQEFGLCEVETNVDKKQPKIRTVKHIKNKKNKKVVSKNPRESLASVFKEVDKQKQNLNKLFGTDEKEIVQRPAEKLKVTTCIDKSMTNKPKGIDFDFDFELDKFFERYDEDKLVQNPRKTDVAVKVETSTPVITKEQLEKIEQIVIQKEIEFDSVFDQIFKRFNEDKFVQNPRKTDVAVKVETSTPVIPKEHLEKIAQIVVKCIMKNGLQETLILDPKVVNEKDVFQYLESKRGEIENIEVFTTDEKTFEETNPTTGGLIQDRKPEIKTNNSVSSLFGSPRQVPEISLKEFIKQHQMTREFLSRLTAFSKEIKGTSEDKKAIKTISHSKNRERLIQQKRLIKHKVMVNQN